MSNRLYDFCQKVTDGIYIVSVESAILASKQNQPTIDAIVDLSGTPYTTNILSLHILMQDIPLTPNTTDLAVEKFATGVKFIQQARASGGNVLVHCAAGINRSATCIGMYLISSGWSYDQVIEALTTANSTRGCPLLTNESFRQLLAAYSAVNTNLGI